MPDDRAHRSLLETLVREIQRFFPDTPFGRLARTHLVAMCADACVAVSLAGSLFFQKPSSGARGSILLYLLLTMAPFAIVAPVIGPALDRLRGGRRLLVVGSCVGRAVLCLALAFVVTKASPEGLLVYPFAFGILVLSKGYSVARSSLVPALVEDDSALVKANSRLALISAIAAVVGGAPAVGVQYLFGADWSVRLAMIVFLFAAVLATRIPRTQVVIAKDEAKLEREELHQSSILLAGSAMAILRGAIGFLQFFAAFTFKSNVIALGIVASGAFVGLLGGTLLAPRIRLHVREEFMLVGALLFAASAVLLGALTTGVFGVTLAFLAVGLSAASGKLGFDSLLQRDGPDAVRGRAFARFETRFQAAWVVGALLGIIPVAVAVGLGVLGLVLAFGGLSYLAALRGARTRPPARSCAPKRSTGPSDGPAPTSATGGARPEPGDAKPRRRLDAKPPSVPTPTRPHPRRSRRRDGARPNPARPPRPPAGVAPAPAEQISTPAARLLRASPPVNVTFRPIDASELPAYARATSIGFSEPPGWLDEHPNWAALDLDRTCVGFDGDDLVAHEPQLHLRPHRARRCPSARRRGQRGHRPPDAPPTRPAALDDARAPRRRDETQRAGRDAHRQRRGDLHPLRVRDHEPHDGHRARPPRHRVRAAHAPTGPCGCSNPTRRPRSNRACSPACTASTRERCLDPTRGGATSSGSAAWASASTSPTRRPTVASTDTPATGSARTSTVRSRSTGSPSATSSPRPPPRRRRSGATCAKSTSSAPSAIPARRSTSRCRGCSPRTGPCGPEVSPTRSGIGSSTSPPRSSARTYPQPGCLGLLVHDEFRPGGRADGAFTLDATGDQPVVHDGGDPDLACDVSALSAAWLGGVRFSTLAAAGVVEERTAGALTRADRLFASHPLPYPFTWF